MKNKFLSLFVILVIGLISLISFVSAHTGEDEAMHHENEGCGMMAGMGDMIMGNYGFGGMAFGWIFSVLIIIVLILLIAWLIKQIQK